jgi:hypothetical protein
MTLLVLFATVLFLPLIALTQIKDPILNNPVFGTSGGSRILIQNKSSETFMNNGENREYEIVDKAQAINSSYKIGFLVPSFTYAAYHDNSFYDFYHKYKDAKRDVNITTDLALLRNNEIPNGPFLVYNAKPGAALTIPYGDYFSILKEQVEQIVPQATVTDISDVDVHFGRIFNPKDYSNLYDILFLFHSEYVTQEEYDNLRLFVSNGGTIVFTDANVLYAEIKYDPSNNSITLVKGHNWEFDGSVAKKSIAERWPRETSEWTGSNFMYGRPTFVDLDFLNMPFNYTHSEEQHVTNKNAKILHNYHVHDPKDPDFNATVATYEMNYGKGKVIGISLYGHTLVGKNGFDTYLKLFDYIIIPHSLRAKDYKLVDGNERILLPSIMNTGIVSKIEVNNQLQILTLHMERQLLQKDSLTVSIPRILISPMADINFDNSSEGYEIMADGVRLDFDYIALDSETGFGISLPSDATRVQIRFTFPNFSIDAPKDISLEAQGRNNSLTKLGQPRIYCSSQDPSCNNLIISENAPASFPIGSTYVTWVAKHPHSGLTVRDLQKVTIYDEILPYVSITHPPTNSSEIRTPRGIFNISGIAYDKAGIEKVEAFAYDLPFDGGFSYLPAAPAADGDWSKWSMSFNLGNKTEIGISVRATDISGNRNWDKGIFSLYPES